MLVSSVTTTKGGMAKAMAGEEIGENVLFPFPLTHLHKPRLWPLSYRRFFHLTHRMRSSVAAGDLHWDLQPYIILTDGSIFF